jgi:hypothetical protein
MFSQRGQSLTYDLRKLNLIRNEMTVFVGQYYNFLCTFIMQAQWKKLQKDVNKLKLKGELTIDTLKKGWNNFRISFLIFTEAHDEYLRHIKTGCLLTSDMKRFLSHKNKMMGNIVIFCVCFTKYLVAEDDDLLNTFAALFFENAHKFQCICGGKIFPGFGSFFLRHHAVARDKTWHRRIRQCLRLQHVLRRQKFEVNSLKSSLLSQ